MYKTTLYFPCLCEECKEIVDGNLKSENLRCPNCNSLKITPYNNKTLIGEVGKNEVAKSFDNILTDGFYLCPKCYNMSLQFKAGILWD